MSVVAGLRRLGDPHGKTERQWIAAMRRCPDEVSHLDDGNRLLSWHSGHYLRQCVAVVFNPQHLFVAIDRCTEH